MSLRVRWDESALELAQMSGPMISPGSQLGDTAQAVTSKFFSISLNQIFCITTDFDEIGYLHDPFESIAATTQSREHCVASLVVRTMFHVGSRVA